MCVICFGNISIKMATFSAWKTKLQLSAKLTYVSRSFPIIVRVFFLSITPPLPFGIFPLPKFAAVMNRFLRNVPFRKGKKIYFKISKGHPRPALGDHSKFYTSLWCQGNSQTQPGISVVYICNLSQTSVSELSKPQGRKVGIFPPEWLFK